MGFFDRIHISNVRSTSKFLTHPNKNIEKKVENLFREQKI